MCGVHDVGATLLDRDRLVLQERGTQTGTSIQEYDNNLPHISISAEAYAMIIICTFGDGWVLRVRQILKPEWLFHIRTS